MHTQIVWQMLIGDKYLWVFMVSWAPAVWDSRIVTATTNGCFVLHRSIDEPLIRQFNRGNRPTSHINSSNIVNESVICIMLYCVMRLTRILYDQNGKRLSQCFVFTFEYVGNLFFSVHSRRTARIHFRWWRCVEWLCDNLSLFDFSQINHLIRSVGAPRPQTDQIDNSKR